MTTALDRPTRQSSGRQQQSVTVTGVLDIDATGKGYLRGATSW